jgi:hypothetical protein
MASSGCAVAQAGSIFDERRHGRAHAPFENVDAEVGIRKIGKSGPIDADGSGPQRAQQASSANFGREGAGCEVIEIMQILPRFEQ